MSGTVLSVALAGSVVAATAIAIPLYSVLVARQAVVASADAAALAAADVVVGLEPGVPCERASLVAAANGSSVARCDTDGLVVTVVTVRSILGFEVTAAATAGPPPGEAD